MEPTPWTKAPFQSHACWNLAAPGKFQPAMDPPAQETASRYSASAQVWTSHLF